MRSFAGLFFMSVIALLSLNAPSFSGASPTRGATVFPPPCAETVAPTPSAGPDGYRLKAWTEQDAIEAISEARCMMYVPFPEGGADAAWLYLGTIVQEALIRFPGSHSLDEISWWYIGEEVDRDYGYQHGAPAERFVHNLEKALNADQVGLPNIGDWLEKRGFEVLRQYSANNFYGDGQEGQFLEIQGPLLGRESELWVIAEGVRVGDYRVASVMPNWRSHFAFWGGEPILLNDYNGNGRPEIYVVSEGSSREWNQSLLYLYEWQGDRAAGHLENLLADANQTWANNYYKDGSEYRDAVKRSWFGSPDSIGAQPLFAILDGGNPARWTCRSFELEVRYEWNGHKYVWVRGDAAPPYPLQPPECIAGWAVAAANHGLYDQAIAVYVAVLADWPGQLSELWGPSAKDYFQFKMGTWYAFAGQYDLAVATLMDVRDHPADRDHDMVSRMTGVFLSRYRALDRADDACDAVIEFVRADFGRIPKEEHPFEADDATIPHWGFAEPRWQFDVNPSFRELCDRGRLEAIPPPPDVPTLQPGPTPSFNGIVSSSPLDLQAQPTERIESIEEALFKDGDTRQAALLARRLLAERIPAEEYKGSKEVEPHLLYLLALSSELAGDKKGAVAAYWQLLQEHPKSHYAAMARRKLEPVTP